MSYRPDGWKCKYLGKKANRYFELGAEAMLEGLLKIDTCIKCDGEGRWEFISPAFGCPKIIDEWIKGRFVFIPEEVG